MYLSLLWDVISHMSKDGGVACVFLYFWTGMGVYVGVCVCIRTHTHTLHMGSSDVSPGVGTKHLESTNNPDGLNLDTCVFIYVYKVHTCLCMLGGGMRC
jgi:hypothetical protein